MDTADTVETLDTVVMRQGTITLPGDIRAKYQLEDGATFTLLGLNGALLLIPNNTQVDQLTAEIEQMRWEAGVSLQDMLSTLRQDREHDYQASQVKQPGD